MTSFLKIFLSISLFTLSLSSPLVTYEILTDLPQTLTLTPQVPVLFQVLSLTTSQVGEFHVIVSSESNSSVVVRPKRCQNVKGEHFKPIKGESKIAFKGDTKDTHCFEVEMPANPETKEETISVIVRFTPQSTLIKSEKSYSFGFDSNSKREFAINLTDSSTEIVYIRLSNDAKLEASDSLYLQLKQRRGGCSQYLPMNWICLVDPNQQLLKFDLLNPRSSSDYTIFVSEIHPQKLLFELDAELQATIPGLGSLFAVTLPLPGVLKVLATSRKSGQLPIVASPSLETLFNAIAQNQAEIPYLDVRTSNEDGLVVQNKESDSQWYYFVKEKSEETFNLVSYFNRQIALNLDVEAMYFIDPSIFEYQYIEVKLGNRNFPEKYEIVLQAEQSDSLMNIYYDTNSYEISYSPFPDKNFYRKKASPTPIKEDQLVLSFIVGTHDTSAYITIQALTKGFYTVRATKVEPRSVWQGIFFVGTLSSLVAYIFSCITRIFKFVKSDEFEDFPEWMQYNQNNGSNNSSIEREVEDLETQSEIALQESQDIDPYGRREAFKRFVKMIRKLRKQEKIERKEKLGRQRQSQEEVSTERVEEEENDEDKCDICYEMKKTVTFQPCKHHSACAFCALAIIETSSKCPLCRAEILKVEINNEIIEKKEETRIDIGIDIEVKTPTEAESKL